MYVEVAWISLFHGIKWIVSYLFSLVFPFSYEAKLNRFPLALVCCSTLIVFVFSLNWVRSLMGFPLCFCFCFLVWSFLTVKGRLIALVFGSFLSFMLVLSAILHLVMVLCLVSLYLTLS